MSAHGAERVSCSNCWFNGLQYGSVGQALGYCVEHRLVLQRADETTCARHIRKDLTSASAEAQQVRHAAHFQRTDGPQRLADAAPIDNGAYLTRDTRFLRIDPVGEAVANYGELDSTIESLAILSSQRTFRADLALFSLARAYTRRCAARGGPWTSGLHLLKYARERLESPPAVQPADLRQTTAVPLTRQIELAEWGLVVLRVLFIADVARYAQRDGDPVGALADLPERAAAATGAITLKGLQSWVKRDAIPAFEAALPWTRYVELARELHRPPPR